MALEKPPRISGSSDFTAALQRACELPLDSKLSEADREAAIKLCVFFELVAAICNHGYMSSKLIEEFYGSLVVDTYRHLQQFVAEHRKHSGRSSFAKNFELLASRLAAVGRGPVTR